MYVRKVNKKIIGADLTKNEEKAMKIEIMKQLAEYDAANCREIDALVLWILHCITGYGYQRLKKFYFLFDPALRKLIAEYDLAASDDVWFCTKLLKDQYNIDLAEWEKEAERIKWENRKEHPDEADISYEHMMARLKAGE